VERQAPNLEEALGLPSNATSIRSEITDSFSCESRIYGYYADVENECQLFHVCLPVQFADGKDKIFKWSFICPEETVFNQVMYSNYNKTGPRLYLYVFLAPSSQSGSMSPHPSDIFV
jgi:hypothetical protein